ncbi:hypothetical protein ES703_75114 [subsurface metagenome]
MVVKSAKEIAAKWGRVTPDRIEDYEDGVRNPQKDWEKETLDAEENYEAGIRESISNKSFSKGVKKAGTAKQQSASILKGIPRWPEGVRGAVDAMESGMGPVVDVLSKLVLPKRYPTGDPRNIKRVEAVQVALHKLKTG